MIFIKNYLKLKTSTLQEDLKATLTWVIANFLPNLKNWNDYIQNSSFEIKALEYFEDKIDSNEKLIWENNNQINKKTFIGKISLLEEINQLIYYLNNEELVPINLESIKGLSENSYNRFSNISLPRYKNLKAIVIISYKKISNNSETIKYYPNSQNEDSFSEKDLLNKDNIRKIYLNYGEILILNPKLIYNLDHIINFKDFKCLFYESSKNQFSLKNIQTNIIFNQIKK